MAEGSQQGWWNSWIQTAKEKSANALEFVKKDLAEFQNTMKTDTNKIATGVKDKISSENAIAATQKAKEGVSSIFGGITKALIVEAEDKPVKKVSVRPTKQIFDRSKARVNAIQVDPDTYTARPSGLKEEFEEWLKTFNLDDQKGEVSELLVVNVEVRALYTQLVPSQVSHADFWQRYFYKMHQLQLDEKRKAALMKRADDVQEQVGWDDEDDWGDLEGPSSPPRQSGMHLAAAALSADAKDDTEEPSSGTVAALDKTSDEENSTAEEKPQAIAVSDNDKPVNSTDITNLPQSSLGVDAVSDHSQVSETPGPKQSELKSESLPCQSAESSLSISSLTDSMKPMDTSADTLTMVSPLEEGPSETKKVIEDPKKALEDNLPVSTLSLDEKKAPAGVDAIDSEKDVTMDSVKDVAKEKDVAMDSVKDVEGSGVCCVDVKSDSSSIEVIESGSEEEIKTKTKGDLVVVGSGVSSDRTTPSSTTDSSNKEVDDDWEQEFEVSEEDLKQLQAKTSSLPTDTNTEEMDDDWESWD